MTVGLANQGLAFDSSVSFFVIAITSLVTGAVFMMWLGEQITERGIGNGISLLIFAGIVAGLPAAIGQSLEQARQGELNILVLLAIFALAVVVIYLVVFIERGQRRVTVNYAKRQQGRQAFQAQASAFTPQGQYGRCYSSHFCQFNSAFPRIGCSVVWQCRQCRLATGLSGRHWARAAVEYHVVYRVYYFLLLLLYRVDVQSRWK